MTPMSEPRSCFNPCKSAQHVYLCGCWSWLLEVYTPASDSYHTLAVDLPELSECCVYLQDQVLVVHMTHYIVRCTVNEDQWVVGRHDRVGTSQTTLPIIDLDSGLVYIMCREECISLRMSTGALHQTYPLPSN